MFFMGESMHPIFPSPLFFIFLSYLFFSSCGDLAGFWSPTKGKWVECDFPVLELHNPPTPNALSFCPFPFLSIGGFGGRGGGECDFSWSRFLFVDLCSQAWNQIPAKVLIFFKKNEHMHAIKPPLSLLLEIGGFEWWMMLGSHNLPPPHVFPFPFCRDRRVWVPKREPEKKSGERDFQRQLEKHLQKIV